MAFFIFIFSYINFSNYDNVKIPLRKTLLLTVILSAITCIVSFFSCFHRYFSVTRPLTYRAKRTTKRAMTMIGLAWSISFILWAPAILLWQYIVGERTVQPNECYIQFLSEPIITFCTAIAAFYLPVTIMAFLFWKIYQETEKRAKDVQSLKGSGSGSSPTQDQNPGSGAGRNSGQGSNTSKRISLAMLHQISTQSCSSCELNQSSSQKRNKKKVVSAAEMGNPSRCGAFCFQVSSLLSSDRASKRSCNTSTVGDAEHSSCENCISEEAGVSGDGIASEMEADEVDQSQPSTGWIQPYQEHFVGFLKSQLKFDFVFLCLLRLHYIYKGGKKQGQRANTNYQKSQRVKSCLFLFLICCNDIKRCCTGQTLCLKSQIRNQQAQE
ncbi:muscarinic acetylcholine receptor M3-like [Nothobranchius furzeri]|uniref:Muscarinic acetylcholine receptor M3-like n=1 Tax=Nothobranchius furzeri TaxID=105023 RepID=A0A9D2XMF1_NOTFU|nr:muscarinic acetylcholine receptor M3-like [Nothobranchius furzeri]